MQVYRRQDSPSFQELKVKIRNEEAAVGYQIRKYKSNYFSKVIAASQLEPFVIFSKELSTLITSHCKNIIMVSPQSLYSVFEQINLLFDDVLNKYHHLSVKFNAHLMEHSLKNDTKIVATSELCSICGKQRKKAQIQVIRKELLHLSDFKMEKENDEGSQQHQEDLLFFSQVNNLLTAQQGNILRNQIQINKYQDIVLQSLNGLIAAQKELFEKEDQSAPNRKWMESAKEEMRQTLKEYFSDMIPPWINKMLNYFLQIELKQKNDKQREVETQTENSYMSELNELKKKIFISKTKIEQYQSSKKKNQKQFEAVSTQKQALEQKITYYKSQMNKLLEEIDVLKSDNQIIKAKLHNSRLKKIYDDNRSEMQIEREGSKQSMRDTIKTNMSLRRKQKVSQSESKILPKIDQIMNSVSKEARTSIRIDSQQISGLQRSERVKKTIKMIQQSQKGSETSTVHDEHPEQTKKQLNISTQRGQSKDSKERKSIFQHRQSKEIELKKSILSRKQSREDSQTSSAIPTIKQKEIQQPKEHFDFPTNYESIIKEEDGQTNLEQEKMQIKKVNDQLKDAIQKGLLQKNGHKHFYSSTFPILKKIPSKTVKHQYPSEFQTRESRETLTNSSPPRVDSILGLNVSKIYNELVKAGYLVKISEEQFKSIIKIKTFQAHQQTLPLPQLNEGQMKQVRKNNRQDRLTMIRREWNQNNFCPERTMTTRPTVSSSYQQYQKDYLILFTNERNAYNYQASLTKNHTRGVYKMSVAQKKLSQQLFQKLNQMKQRNHEQYRYICSYLRFPFQMMQNNLEVNFLNDMKYTSFEYYLERIMGIHTKCKKHDGICMHMTLFKNKIFDK